MGFKVVGVKVVGSNVVGSRVVCFIVGANVVCRFGASEGGFVSCRGLKIVPLFGAVGAGPRSTDSESSNDLFGILASISKASPGPA